MTNRKQILVENTIWVYVAKLITQLVGLLASVLVIRQLDVEIYGTYVFIFGLFTAYQLFITSPLKHVLIRFIPELKTKVSSSSLGHLLLMYLSLAITMVIVLTGLAILFKDALAEFFNINSFNSYIPAFLFFVLSYAVKILLEVLLSAFLLHRKMAILNIVVVLIRAISYLVMLSQLNVNTLLVIEAIVSLVYALPAIVVLIKNGRYIRSEIKEEISSDDKKRIRRFWSYSFFTELGAGLIGRTSDYYIVAAMSSPYFIGLYGFAIKVYELFYKFLPLKEFESVLKPLVFEKFNSQSDDQALNRFYNFAVKVLLPVFIFPFLYFLIFGKVIIVEVFGDKYLTSYWTTVLILAGFIFDGLFYPLVILIQLKEKLKVILVSRIVVGFSIIAGVLMMKHFGIVGVAIATLLGELLKNLLMFLMFRPYCDIRYDKKIFLSNGLLLLIGILLFLPLQGLFNSIWFAILASLCYVLFYCTYLLKFHGFNKNELDDFKSIVNANQRLSAVYQFVSRLIRLK